MDSSDGHPIWLVIFLLLTTADFLLAALGAALQSVSDSVLDEAEKEGRKEAARAHSLKHSPSHLISASWFYMILTIWPAAAYCQSMQGWIRYAAAVLLSMILYLGGKSVPHLAGRKYADRFCFSLIQPVYFLISISRPFTGLLNLINFGLVRLFGINPREFDDEVTEDEILNMVNEGHEQGVLDEHEAEMISNIFQWGDTEAQDIMTHRKHICAIDGSLQLTEAITFIVGEPNSRFPVYEENIDNIVGVLHLRDAVAAHEKGGYDNWKIKDIPDLMRPVIFIPETRNIDDLFRSMQSRKMQMVIVVDEYGETAGLVTMEDILEEIVGNILDEYDVDEHFILPDGENSYLLAGLTPLEQVEEALHVSFDTEDYDTLNGYLISRLDRIPDPQDHSEIIQKEWSFSITKVDHRMIQWVRAVKLLPDNDGAAQSDNAHGQMKNE